MKLFKILAIASVILLSLQASFAQEKLFFGTVKSGAALPMGEMASHKLGTGGYALLGPGYSIQTGYFFYKNLGFIVDISFKNFPFASGFYLEDYIESEPFFTHVDMLSTNYKVRTFMAGMLYKAHIYKKLSSDFKLMGGLFSARTPDQFYVVNAYDAGTLYFWKTTALSRKPGVMAGASLRYDLYEMVTLSLNGTFSYTRSAFTFTRDTGGYTDLLHMPIFSLEPGITVKF